MATVKVRYITKRTGPNGREYWYWQRKGFPLQRLPDDKAKRLYEAERLNAWADAQLGRKPRKADDCVTRLIRLYEESERYLDLAPGTRIYYDRKLRDVGKVWGDLPVSFLTRKAVVDFIETYETPGERKKAAAVLYNLFDLAIYRGWASENLAKKLRIKTPARREQIWSEEECQSFLDACQQMGWPDWKVQRVSLYFTLLRYTVQRPGDAASLTWGQYEGDTIKLRQQKTKRLVEVPCHRDLRAELDAQDRNTIHILARPDGKPLPYERLREWESEVRNAAGLQNLQMRDLRRTAMVRMAEAGADIHQIAAVSGHNIERTKHILETYLPRTVEMGKAAIAQWEGKSKTRV
jgi:integrase